jgi:hypothetical protein
MEGRIIQFSIESQQGYVRTKCGKVYRFSASIYRSLMPIIPGELVDLDLDFDGGLKAIYIALPIKCLELLTRVVSDY